MSVRITLAVGISNLWSAREQRACQLTLRKLFTIVPPALDRRVFRCYIVGMKIEVTSPSPQVAEAVRQHLGLSTHTYELWFLGDVCKIRSKNRDSFDALLKEAHEMLTDALPIMIGGCNGAEIFHRSQTAIGGVVVQEHTETVWSMSFDEFKKL